MFTCCFLCLNFAVLLYLTLKEFSKVFHNAFDINNLTFHEALPTCFYCLNI